MAMRYSIYKTSDIQNNTDMVKYAEEVFRKEFQKAMKDGNIYATGPIKKGKRFRSAFTTEQVNYLEKEFRNHPYIGNTRRKEVASVLKIPERAVKIWFQNRRMKEKKQSDGDRTVETSDQTSNISNSLSNVSSLPTIAMATSNQIFVENVDNRKSNEAKKTTDVNSNNFSIYYDISPASSPSSVDNINSSTSSETKFSFVKNAPSATTSTITSSVESSVQEYEKLNTKTITTTNTFENDQKHKRKERSESNAQGVCQMESISSCGQKTEYPNVSYASYVLPSVPQDLSFKPQEKESNSVQQSSQEIRFNQPDVPVYLKGFYAQPYIPPSNMVWKPVNVAPIMSTPIPAVAVPPISGHQSIIKRNCSCDCHMRLEPPVYYQNSHAAPNMQYVITALPFQSPPKF